MKTVNLLLVAIFALSLSCAIVPENVYAKSGKKETTMEDKKGKARKAIPKNININTASKEVLTQLPGIGPVTANEILKYRKANGKFANINELTKVKGIGAKTLAKIKKYLKKI